MGGRAGGNLDCKYVHMFLIYCVGGSGEDKRNSPQDDTMFPGNVRSMYECVSDR